MPPRYAYWTILIDSKPTAFRAAKQEELLPTLAQLQRTNKNVIMKWFARGRIWENPEQAQWASRNMDAPQEKRGSGWRPGGRHEDPRARFDRKKRDKRGTPPAGDRPWSGKPRHDRGANSHPPKADDAARAFSPTPPRPEFSGDRRPRPPFKKPFGSRPPAAESGKPFRPRSDEKPYGARPFRKPSGDRPAGKPYGAGPSGPPPAAPPRRPFTGPPRGKSFDGGRQASTGDRIADKGDRDRPAGKPYGSKPRGKSFRDRPQSTGGADRNRPWTPGPRPAKAGDRPWGAKPPAGGDRPWPNKPSSSGDAKPSRPKPPSARPWAGKPSGRPDRPAFKRDARRPPPKPFGQLPPRSDGTDKKHNREDDES